MSKLPLASIIVNNYNYARFLREAVDSALNQSYPNTEAIVVDDGSTDGSREIIASYGRRVIPVLKENGGQTSALNASFRVSRGQVIFFVDADDALMPTTVERAMQICLEPSVAKVHWPLLEIDVCSRETGKVWCENLPEGDLRETLLCNGPDSIHHPPQTGNAFSRDFLEKVFPMPEVEKQFNLPDASADMVLSGLAPLYGQAGRISQPQGYYRMHGKNRYSCLNFDDRLRRDVLTYDHQCAVVARHCAQLGIPASVELWKRKSWVHRLGRAADGIAAFVPPGGAFILVDEDAWKTDPFLAGRKRVPFLEHNDQYWGNPPDDATAIRELERLRKAGAGFIVFAWATFWWLEFYVELHQYLRSRFPCVREDDLLIVFDLREPQHLVRSS